MTLELEYELKERNALTPLTDALFIRRALRDSLKRSLVRFARERAADIDRSDAEVELTWWTTVLSRRSSADALM